MNYIYGVSEKKKIFNDVLYFEKSETMTEPIQTLKTSIENKNSLEENLQHYIPLHDTLLDENLMLQEAFNIAKKWSPPVTLNDKLAMMDIITSTELTLGNCLLKKYIEMIRPYTKVLGLSGEDNKPKETDCLASGFIFFYGCLFYIMHFPNWGQHVEDIFLYNLLYILVDHYIDDMNMDSEIKDKAITQMFILVNNPLSHEILLLADPVLKTIALIYHKLITRCPSTKEPIITLLKAEIEGFTIQKNGNLSREKYYDIASRKGGNTVQVLQYIVGNIDPTINDASFQLGLILQLIDDCLDNYADTKNNIHTIATYDLKYKHILDDLWIDIVHRINNIDERFTIFKIFYMIFAIYIPNRFPQDYTKKLVELTKSLNLFNFNASLLLVENIMSELTAAEMLANN
jgi:hypothetical protein